MHLQCVVWSCRDCHREEKPHERGAEDIIKKITDDNFVIDKIVEDKDTGETIIIIKFDDAESAKNFVDAIEASSNSDLDIRVIGFLPENPLSLSPACKPPFFLFFFFSFN